MTGTKDMEDKITPESHNVIFIQYWNMETVCGRIEGKEIKVGGPSNPKRMLELIGYIVHRKKLNIKVKNTCRCSCSLLPLKLGSHEKKPLN